MSDPNGLLPIDRLFCRTDRERLDEFGFLDCDRSPQLFHIDEILSEPLAWVLGSPWLGKTTVAECVQTWLRSDADGLGGIGNRVALTKLGAAGVERDLPPLWWREWLSAEQPQRAVWLVDAVDEGLDRNAHAFELILQVLGQTGFEHLRELRLILFSRPSSELGDFRKRLDGCFGGVLSRTESPRFWLTRLSRSAAEKLIGEEHTSKVFDVIQRNKLQQIAGFPVVLNYLRRYPETKSLSIADVSRGILKGLLGESVSNSRARFISNLNDRVSATDQIAAIQVLTGRDMIREHSPDPTELTIGTLFQRPDNRVLEAAFEACRTPVFAALPQQGRFRFVHRNVQDWFAAFASHDCRGPRYDQH